MNIEGLDYNTQREKLVLPEYGREIKKMVDHAMSLPTKEERQRCANTIIDIMERMVPQNRDNQDYKHKLWDHLALLSNYQLDIDWPYDVSGAQQITAKPEPLGYPMTHIPVRHYGKMMPLSVEPRIGRRREGDLGHGPLHRRKDTNRHRHV